MDSRTPVEVADRRSRQRAVLIALAAVALIVSQLVMTPPHTVEPAVWTFCSIAYLLLIVTGGGLLHQTKIRALMNDEVSRDHHRTAVSAGFWVAMLTALLFYWVPGVESRTARHAFQLVVTLSVAATLLVFAGLELRAHRSA